ncbi:MAG TPA: hypothetical protein VKW08_05800 [Xanthobacteraceae bacterium]|jgi:hypothetical protein|nr:hypothetical protein [Xanthobacteraceae bacterium]
MSDVVIIGAGGVIAPLLAEQLTERGAAGICYSRRAPLPARGNFTIRDFSHIRSDCPIDAIVISPLPIGELARLLPELPRPRHVIAMSSSQFTSRHMIEPLEASVREFCESAGTAWTILRPTMIYFPPIDRNVTALARIIRRFRFFPFWGRMTGLRQPVHAEDIAVAVAQVMGSEQAKGAVLALPGGETLTFRSMVERIFRALELPPIMVPMPRLLLNFALRAYLTARPSVIAASGLPEDTVDRVIAQMNHDMVLDAAPAHAAFGYSARPFAPAFPKSF